MPSRCGHVAPFLTGALVEPQRSRLLFVETGIYRSPETHADADLISVVLHSACCCSDKGLPRRSSARLKRRECAEQPIGQYLDFVITQIHPLQDGKRARPWGNSVAPVSRRVRQCRSQHIADIRGCPQRVAVQIQALQLRSWLNFAKVCSVSLIWLPARLKRRRLGMCESTSGKRVSLLLSSSSDSTWLKDLRN